MKFFNKKTLLAQIILITVLVVSLLNSIRLSMIQPGSIKNRIKQMRNNRVSIGKLNRTNDKKIEEIKDIKYTTVANLNQIIKEEKAASTEIASIELNQDLNNIPDTRLIKFDWFKILKLYKEDNNSFDMKIISAIRISNYKKMILSSLKILIKNKNSIKNSDIDSTSKECLLKGNISSATSCSFNIINTNNQKEYTGKLILTVGGSQNLTSDIDVKVDFIQEITNEINDNKTNKELSPMDKLYIVGNFIKIFNEIFLDTYGQTSAENFDINLYPTDFTDFKIAKTIYKKFDIEKKLIFDKANRLSVLLLIYQDSLKKLKEAESVFDCKDQKKSYPKCVSFIYESQKKLPDKAPDIRLRRLFNQSSECSSVLFTETFDIINGKRENYSFKKRNELVAYNILEASKSPKIDIKLLCHLLASNYWVLEGYVPYGSIFQMLHLYDLLSNIEENDKKFHHNYENPQYPSFINNTVDSLLMNFAYLVEHSFTKDKVDYEKFGKYFSRLYLAVLKLFYYNKKNECYFMQNCKIKDITLEQCFLKTIKKDITGIEINKDKLKSALIQNNELEKKDLRKELNNFKNTDFFESNQLGNIYSFLVDSYQCINDYGFVVNKDMPDFDLLKQF